MHFRWFDQTWSFLFNKNPFSDNPVVIDIPQVAEEHSQSIREQSEVRGSTAPVTIQLT